MTELVSVSDRFKISRPSRPGEQYALDGTLTSIDSSEPFGGRSDEWFVGHKLTLFMPPNSNLLVGRADISGRPDIAIYTDADADFAERNFSTEHRGSLVSRTHFALQTDNGGTLWVRDMGSLNGTYILKPEDKEFVVIDPKSPRILEENSLILLCSSGQPGVQIGFSVIKGQDGKLELIKFRTRNDKLPELVNDFKDKRGIEEKIYGVPESVLQAGVGILLVDVENISREAVGTDGYRSATGDFFNSLRTCMNSDIVQNLRRWRF